MTWEDAKKACAALGDGWRLPTKDELNILYENKDKIGGLIHQLRSPYWSSTEPVATLRGYRISALVPDSQIMVRHRLMFGLFGLFNYLPIHLFNNLLSRSGRFLLCRFALPYCI